MSDLDRRIDEALSTSCDAEPSPFFVARVMSAVRSEVETPPLPFPWKRIAASVMFLLATVVLGVM